MALSFTERKLWAIKVLHCGNKDFWLFAPVTLTLTRWPSIYEHHPYSLEIYWMYKYELPTSRLSKVRLTDRHERNYIPDLDSSAHDRIWQILCSHFASHSRFVTVFSVCKVSLQSFDITPPKSFLSIIIIIPRHFACGQQEITRNSSRDEIANVNFLYDDIVHALQNTIDSCINSITDRRSYVLEHLTPFPRYGWLLVKFSLARAVCLTLMLSLGVIPFQYWNKWYIAKNYIL